MDCIPPWLSSKNQCDKNITYNHNHTKLDIEEILLNVFISPKGKLETTMAEKKCKNPCKKMTNTLSLISQKIHRDRTSINSKFKKTVRVEKKVIVYTWFNFIVDVGSSLGLWLGLSALGITDLVIEVFLLAKNCMK